ncbi:MAG: phosphoribosyltransferase family protein [Gammaproteobacteria bacterium]|nr:phosphoribosyltransferase family protein [Gammaproteobacteria bacterium]
MVEKRFISAQELLQDSFLLGAKIIESGFAPNYIIGIWRGGTPVGIAVQELLDYFGIETDHIAIRTSSYSGIGKQDKEVRVHGLGYLVQNLNAEDSLLIVDDVFDSGLSLQAVIDELTRRTRRNTPHEIRIATPWFKPKNNKTNMVPDFYLHETDQWLVFPHELKDLTVEEIARKNSRLEEVIQYLEPTLAAAKTGS